MDNKLPIHELVVAEFIIESSQERFLNQSRGSLFHGALMELLDGDYVEILHRQELKPYTQCVYYDKVNKLWKWKVTVLTQEACENLLSVLWDVEAITLKYQENLVQIQIREKRIIGATSYKELLDTYFIGDDIYKNCKVQFLTSTTFKSYGAYAIFPDLLSIWKSLLNRWNTFSTGEVFDSSEFLEALMRYSYINHYNLHLLRFGIEGLNLNAFRGSLTIGFKRNEVLQRSMALLLAFSEFSGVGVKTALGMGSMQVALEEVR